MTKTKQNRFEAFNDTECYCLRELIGYTESADAAAKDKCVAPMLKELKDHIANRGTNFNDHPDHWLNPKNTKYTMEQRAEMLKERMEKDLLPKLREHQAMQLVEDEFIPELRKKYPAMDENDIAKAREIALKVYHEKFDK